MAVRSEPCGALSSRRGKARLEGAMRDARELIAGLKLDEKRKLAEQLKEAIADELAAPGEPDCCPWYGYVSMVV